MKNDKVNQLLNDLKSADFCCKQIIRLNMDLEVLAHRMKGLSHNKPTLTKEQEKSNLPMPTFHGGSTSIVSMLYEEELLMQEINYYQRRINECKSIELLSLQDQNILFDLYFFRINQWDVAEKYGYSRKGLWKHVRSEMNKLI